MRICLRPVKAKRPGLLDPYISPGAYKLMIKRNALRHRLLAGTASLILLAGCAAWDPDLRPGWEAYQAGNWGQAYRLWLRPALDGNSDAQYLIGKMFYDTRDYAQALIWFRQAADAGDSSAQHYLTIMTENGFGVEERQVQPWLREDE